MSRQLARETGHGCGQLTGQAGCTAGERERDFCKLLLRGGRAHSGDANPWRSKEMISGS